MNGLKHDAIAGILFVMITGTLAHFIYDWSGHNTVVGLFAPVNESVWEHMKLLFFPMLLYAVFMILRQKEAHPCIVSSLCLGITAGTLLIPILYYTYTGILGRDLFLLDIGTFIAGILCAFWLAYKLALSCKAEPYTVFLCALTGILLLCFIRFTYDPPAVPLFAKPPAAR